MEGIRHQLGHVTPTPLYIKEYLSYIYIAAGYSQISSITMKKMMETTTLDLGWVLSLEASILPFFSCVPCISKCHKIRTFFWTPQNETVWLKKIYYYKIYQNRGLPIQWMMFLFIMVDSIQQFLLSERIFQILELPCPVWFLVFLRHIWGCGCFWTVFDLQKLSLEEEV